MGGDSSSNKSSGSKSSKTGLTAKDYARTAGMLGALGDGFMSMAMSRDPEAFGAASANSAATSVGVSYSAPERISWAKTNNVGMYAGWTEGVEDKEVGVTHSVAELDAAFEASQQEYDWGGFNAPGASDYGTALLGLQNRLDEIAQQGKLQNFQEQLEGQLSSWAAENAEIAQAKQAQAAYEDISTKQVEAINSVSVEEAVQKASYAITQQQITQMWMDRLSKDPNLNFGGPNVPDYEPDNSLSLTVPEEGLKENFGQSGSWHLSFKEGVGFTFTYFGGVLPGVPGTVSGMAGSLLAPDVEPRYQSTANTFDGIPVFGFVVGLASYLEKPGEKGKTAWGLTQGISLSIDRLEYAARDCFSMVFSREHRELKEQGFSFLDRWSMTKPSTPAVVSELDAYKNYIDEKTQIQKYKDGIHDAVINKDANSYRSHPVLIDVKNDGIELTSLTDSPTFIDLDDDTYLENTGWVSADDGILVIDLDEDGVIDQTEELVLTEWAEEAETDLEALQIAFDSNGDLVFDSADERWGEFRVWQDLDQDGEVDEGELRTLEEIGIVSIDLDLASIEDAEVWTDLDGDGVMDDDELSGELPSADAPVIENRDGNVIYRSASVEWEDGNEGKAYDVAFAYNPDGIKQNEQDGHIEIEFEDGSMAVEYEGADDITLDLGESGYTTAFGADGDDEFFTTGEDSVVIEAGAGDDSVLGGDGDDLLSGGEGSDTLSGGAGHDVLIIDSDELPENIDGGDGFDVAYVSGEDAVCIDLDATNFETIYGNAGDDTLYTSGDGDVLIQGGEGNDSISSGAGDDMLAGGEGADTIQAGAGDDIVFIDAEDDLANIDGGDGYDALYIVDDEGVTVDLAANHFEEGHGGSGDDHISTTGDETVLIDGGDGNDTLSGTDQADTLSGGAGNDTLAGGVGDDRFVRQTSTGTDGYGMEVDWRIAA